MGSLSRNSKPSDQRISIQNSCPQELLRRAQASPTLSSALNMLSIFLRYLTSKCLTFHFQKLDNTMKHHWFCEEPFCKITRLMLCPLETSRLTVNLQKQSTHSSFLPSALASLESCGPEDLGQELLPFPRIINCNSRVTWASPNTHYTWTRRAVKSGCAHMCLIRASPAIKTN